MKQEFSQKNPIFLVSVYEKVGLLRRLAIFSQPPLGGGLPWLLCFHYYVPAATNH